MNVLGIFLSTADDTGHSNLVEIELPPSTFYAWYECLLEGGREALGGRKPGPGPPGTGFQAPVRVEGAIEALGLARGATAWIGCG